MSIARSADGWNTFCIARPSRIKYQHRAINYLGCVDHIMPNELRVIIAEYGSTLIFDAVIWGERVTFDQVHTGSHIPYLDVDHSIDWSKYELGSPVASIQFENCCYDSFDYQTWRLQYCTLSQNGMRISGSFSRAIIKDYISKGWEFRISHAICHHKCNEFGFDESMF